MDAFVVKAFLRPVPACMNVVAKRPCLLQHMKVTQQSFVQHAFALITN